MGFATEAREVVGSRDVGQNADMTSCGLSINPVLHPALAGRFSPVVFDSDVMVTSAHVDTLLDAARRAPSAGNSQPWKFIVGRRGGRVHERIVSHLARSSAVWAPAASLLIVNLAQVWVDDTTNLEYSEFSRYDLGQAVAHMTIQGLSVGLEAHQFRAFDQAAIAAEFDVPSHWEVTSMTAFGAAAHAAGDIDAPGTSRDRATLEAVTWMRD